MPSFKNPAAICKIPAKTTATKNASKLPNVVIAAITIVIKPAAGPDTPILLLLKNPTTIPPITPAIKPEKTDGKPETEGTFVVANPTPKHKGNATKKTTKLAGKSFCHVLLFLFIFYI